MIERQAERAVARAIARLEAAGEALPEGVAVERIAGGVALTGAGGAHALIDPRIRNFAQGGRP